MSGLSDLVPTAKPVEINGKKFKTRPISLAEFAGLLTRFPALDSIFSGKGPGVIADILKAGNPAVGAIIAAGLDHADDEKWESDAAAMAAQYQVKFLASIIPATMPGGFGPFVVDLGTVLTALFPPSPDQARDKVLAKATQKRSALSSNAGAEPTKPSGNSAQGNSQPTVS